MRFVAVREKAGCNIVATLPLNADSLNNIKENGFP